MILKKGLSLPELLVATLFASILIGVIGSLLNTQLGIVVRQKALIQSASQNKLGLDEIIKQIRESAGVASSCPNPPCNPVETSGADILVLKLWPINANGEPVGIGGSAYDYIIYKKTNNQLIRRIVPDATSTRPAGSRIISVDIASLAFTYDPAPTPDPSVANKVAVSLGTASTESGKTFTTDQNASAGIRNK